MTRILITGGAGFIGSHFVAHVLRATDWDITIVDRLGEAAHLGRLGAACPRVKFVWHDLKASLVHNPDRLLREEYRYVVHLAAGSHVDRSVKDPLGFVADNVTGTAHMLEFARRLHGLEKFLHFSTDEVFGAANAWEEPFDEYDSFHATNPYAASKAAAEALCPAWASTYGLPITVTRCTNVAGPGQDAEKFIPSTIEKLKRGQIIQVHSRAGVPSSRKYIDVVDVCAAMLTVLNKGGCIAGRNSGYYNIGGRVDWSNVDVVTLLGELMAVTPRYELVEDPPNRPKPDQRYDVKTERLEALGWSQCVPLATTLRVILDAERATA